MEAHTRRHGPLRRGTPPGQGGAVGPVAAERPSLDLQVLRVLELQLRPGAVVVDDNGEDDVVAHLADPANGYRTMTLTLAGRPTRLAVRDA